MIVVVAKKFAKSLAVFVALRSRTDSNYRKIYTLNLHNPVFGRSMLYRRLLCGDHYTDEASRPSPDPITLLRDQRTLRALVRM